jgi:prepilin-type N-terminal cleavage/methylation domain-containing protein
MFKHKSAKGFTIVELLIVIVVIAILAALVLNTFTGAQKRARDAQRQTDVNAIATQLEVYYNDNGGYPLAATVTTTNLKGLSTDALQPPSSTTTAILGVSAAPTVKPVSGTQEAYAYWPRAAGVTCTTAPCDNFILYYWKEDTTGVTNPINKVSLNQP